MRTKMIGDVEYKFPEIPKEFGDNLCMHSYLTGSRAYGGFTEQSDHDHLISPKIAEQYNLLEYFKGYLEELDDYDEDRHNVVKVFIKGYKGIYNFIIFTDNRDYALWQYTTDILRQFTTYPKLRDFIAENREHRVNMFHITKEYMKQFDEYVRGNCCS